MSEDFKKNFSLCLIYSKDLKSILLKQVKNDKLDGLLVEVNTGIDQVEMSKIVNTELDLKIDPNKWQIITTLQNIDRDWNIDVYISAIEIETIDKEGYQICDPFDLPDNCHPNLKWLVPMSIDFTIFGSSFNQILMK